MEMANRKAKQGGNGGFGINGSSLWGIFDRRFKVIWCHSLHLLFDACRTVMIFLPTNIFVEATCLQSWSFEIYKKKKC